MKTIAIIGGGASGLAAAVAAAEETRRAGVAAQVRVYEASDRVGRSILATGNGRCNFSNAVIDAGTYRNAAFVGEALSACEEAFGGAAGAAGEVSGAALVSGALDGAYGGGNAVLAFFAEHGLMWREESEGRLYPLANKATSVLDCLRAALVAADVEELTESDVVEVEAPRDANDRFTLRLADKRLARADAVIVAVGGAACERLLPEGVPFLGMEPTLGPIATDSRWPRQLDNIRVRGALELWRAGKDGDRLVARETGEVMFRKYGVSGIAAFNLSRLACAGDELAVDFVSQVAREHMEAFLAARVALLQKSLRREPTWEDLLRGMVLAPVADVLLKAAGLKGEERTRESDLGRLARVLKALRLPVTGLGDARQCQVHRGGVDVASVIPQTCEMRQIPGLYVVGEALDVDAPCGGFNLHWAWASGLLTGRAAALSIADAAKAVGA